MFNGSHIIKMLNLSILSLQSNIIPDINFKVIQKHRLVDIFMVEGFADERDHRLNHKPEENRLGKPQQTYNLIRHPVDQRQLSAFTLNHLF